MRKGREERQKAPSPDRLASPEAIEEHEVQHTHLRSLRCGGAPRLRRRPRRQHRRRPGAAESDCEEVILARGPTDFQFDS